MIVRDPDGRPVVLVPAEVCARFERALLDAAAVTTGRLGLQLDPAAAAVIAEVAEAAAWARARYAEARVDAAAEARSPSAPMTVAAAARVLRVSPSRVRQRLRDGQLSGHRDHRGRWHVDPAAVRGGRVS